MSHTYTRLLTHLIFSTKERWPFLHDRMRGDVHAYLGGIVRRIKASAVTIGGVSDHVHLLVHLPASLPVAEVVRKIKCVSSGWIHERYPDSSKFAWQTGYGAFSVSESSASAVVRYIQEQEEHHRTRSFQEEFVRFVREHRVEYDERYIWD